VPADAFGALLAHVVEEFRPHTMAFAATVLTTPVAERKALEQKLAGEPVKLVEALRHIKGQVQVAYYAESVRGSAAFKVVEPIVADGKIVRFQVKDVKRKKMAEYRPPFFPPLGKTKGGR
jgi:hypothetical protein